MTFRQLIAHTVFHSLILVYCLNAEELWTFSEPDDFGGDKALSNLGTMLINQPRSTVRVYKESLELSSDGVSDSVFLINAYSGAPRVKGIHEVSWCFTYSAFAQTLEAEGSANVGFDFRDIAGTPYKGKDDVVLGGLRLRYDKSQILIQYQDVRSRSFETIASVERVVLPAPLHVRIRFDLDRAGQAGSMQVFLQLGDEAEMHALTEGCIPDGARLSGYRLVQQTLNGNTNWRPGDVVRIDDFAIREVD